MQNKGFVKVIAVLLTVVCAFYLSFTFVTRHHEKEAAQYAGGESVYIDSIMNKKVYLGVYTYKQAREMGIGLGLDRLTNIKYGITDIRLLYENDIRFLKQFK